MSTVADDTLQWVQTTTGGPPYSLTVKEAASQTFVAGEIVVVVAGYATEIASDTPALIFGVAEEDAHNDTTAGTHEVSIYLGIPSNVFAANCKQGSLADHVLVQSDLVSPMAIQRDTTNSKVFLNASTKGGANTRVFTYRTGQNTNIGDTNGRVTFVFQPAFIQGETTS